MIHAGGQGEAFVWIPVGFDIDSCDLRTVYFIAEHHILPVSCATVQPFPKGGGIWLWCWMRKIGFGIVPL